MRYYNYKGNGVRLWDLIGDCLEYDVGIFGVITLYWLRCLSITNVVCVCGRCSVCNYFREAGVHLFPKIYPIPSLILSLLHPHIPPFPS